MNLKEKILRDDIARLIHDKDELKKENEILKANTDYISMMADIDIPDEVKDEQV